MEKGAFKDFVEDVQFITPDVTQLIKLYEGKANQYIRIYIAAINSQ